MDGLRINKTQRVLRLMRAHTLLVKPNDRLKAPQTPGLGMSRTTAPQQWWGIDMTKMQVEPVGWGYLVLVLSGIRRRLLATVPGRKPRPLTGFCAGTGGAAPIPGGVSRARGCR